MDILNFSAPLGTQQLNFGADDFEGYIKYNKRLFLDYKNYPIIYIEFDWKYSLDKNITRFFTLKVTDKEGAFISKASTPFLRFNTDNLVSLVLDLSKFKTKDLVIDASIFVEELEENNYIGIDNLRIFIGRSND